MSSENSSEFKDSISSSEEDIEFYYSTINEEQLKNKKDITRRIIKVLSAPEQDLFIIAKNMGINTFDKKGKIKSIHVLKKDVIKVVNYLYKIKILENKGKSVDKKYKKAFSHDLESIARIIFNINPSKKSLEKTREKIIAKINEY